MLDLDKIMNKLIIAVILVYGTILVVGFLFDISITTAGPDRTGNRLPESYGKQGG